MRWQMIEAARAFWLCFGLARQRFLIYRSASQYGAQPFFLFQASLSLQPERLAYPSPDTP